MWIIIVTFIQLKAPSQRFGERENVHGRPGKKIQREFVEVYRYNLRSSFPGAVADGSPSNHITSHWPPALESRALSVPALLDAFA